MRWRARFTAGAYMGAGMRKKAVNVTIAVVNAVGAAASTLAWLGVSPTQIGEAAHRALPFVAGAFALLFLVFLVRLFLYEEITISSDAEFGIESARPMYKVYIERIREWVRGHRA